MFKSVFRRLLRALCVAISLLITTLCVAGYLAVQVPDYYAAWQSRQPTPEELATATANIENARAEYLRWRSRLQAEGPGVLRHDTHKVCFTDADLNVLLAAESRKAGDVRIETPRIRATPNQIDVAAGVRTSVTPFVLSTSLTPSLNAEGVLTLEIESLRLGWLPLPIETLVRFLPRESHRLSGSLHLDLTEPKPRLAIDLSDPARSLLADSLECIDGEVTLRFVSQPREG